MAEGTSRRIDEGADASAASITIAGSWVGAAVGISEGSPHATVGASVGMAVGAADGEAVFSGDGGAV